MNCGRSARQRTRRRKTHKVGTAPALEEYTERGDEDGEDDLENGQRGQGHYLVAHLADIGGSESHCGELSWRAR